MKKESKPDEKLEAGAAIELNPQEQEVIKALRGREVNKKACAAEIDTVLKKYNATIGINPDSPFGKPEIIVSIR